MCQECWIAAGSPMILNDAVKACASMIQRFRDEHVGGSWAHIVVEDWNLEDDSIEHCLREARKHADDGSTEVLRTMMGLTEDERYSAMALATGVSV